MYECIIDLDNIDFGNFNMEVYTLYKYSGTFLKEEILFALYRRS